MGRVPHRRLPGRRTRRGLAPIRFRAKPYRVEDALTLERDTGLKRPVAVTLARRGVRTATEAREFLAAAESHAPSGFEGMSEVSARVLETIRQGRRITIYGDFDCDGVCATAILVGVIRELGGECDWFIPDRITEGYGLNGEAIEEIARRGTALVITVDCGVTATGEVALARRLGMEIIVTDHHQPGPELPDCPILHPVVSNYPFASLCGAAVAAKLASALREIGGGDESGDEADLDLVALATVADVMPLKGENRHLVRAGLKVARRARRVGLAALMAEARIEPSRLSSEDLGFRLAPRINAAGRMFRADAGVELMLADSPARAAEIGRELSAANAERRRVEREVETAARAELRKPGEPGPAVVVAGEGWHPGVVGIVASRLARSEGRPAIVIALDGETGRGSGRSVPGLDLHACLSETSHLLESFGGHAAAAGLGIRRENLDEFRAAFDQAVIARTGGEAVEPVIEFDAVTGGGDLGLGLAEEIEQLQPFGAANPPVTVLIPAATIEDLREMGEGRHCRFSICSGGRRAKGVAFGRCDLGVADGERVDLIAEMSVNHWNGSIESQLRVTEALPFAEAGPLAGVEGSEWWQRFEAAMKARFEAPPAGSGTELTLACLPSGPAEAAVAEMISSGERVAVLTADANRRWRDLGGSSLARFLPDASREAAGEQPIAGIWAGSPAAEVARAREAAVLLTDYASLDGPVREALAGFDRVALFDPPFRADSLALLASLRQPIHLLAGPEENAFAAAVATRQLDLTAQLRDLFRAFRAAGGIDGGELTGEELRQVLASDGSAVRSPEQAAALLRVLTETGHARSRGEGSARAAGVVSSEKTKLTASSVFIWHFELHKEQSRFLSQFNSPRPNP